jgi:hypothetical protein
MAELSFIMVVLLLGALILVCIFRNIKLLRTKKKPTDEEVKQCNKEILKTVGKCVIALVAVTFGYLLAKSPALEENLICPQYPILLFLLCVLICTVSTCSVYLVFLKLEERSTLSDTCLIFVLVVLLYQLSTIASDISSVDFLRNNTCLGYYIIALFIGSYVQLAIKLFVWTGVFSESKERPK